MRTSSRESSLAVAALLCGVMAAREPRLVPLLTLGGWTGSAAGADAATWAEEAPAAPDATGAVRAENEAARWRDAVAGAASAAGERAARPDSGLPAGEERGSFFATPAVSRASARSSRAAAPAARSEGRRRASPTPARRPASSRAPGAEADDEYSFEALHADGAAPASRTGSVAARGARSASRPRFLGPATSDDENESTAARGAPRRGGKSAHAWAFRPDARARRAARRASHPGRLRPLTLSKRLGKGALKPPSPSLAPANLVDLRGRGTAGALLLEGLDPGDRVPACRRRATHWDGEVRHEGLARGLRLQEHWLWLRRASGRWWAGIGAEPDAYLRHGAGWWLKQKGLWYLSHMGMPWYPRATDEWGESVLLHPPSGTKMVYSADLSLVALIVPGDGAALYDARSGTMLARWSEADMPRRRHRAPPSLTLP